MNWDAINVVVEGTGRGAFVGLLNEEA